MQNQYDEIDPIEPEDEAADIWDFSGALIWMLLLVIAVIAMLGCASWKTPTGAPENVKQAPGVLTKVQATNQVAAAALHKDASTILGAKALDDTKAPANDVEAQAKALDDNKKPIADALGASKDAVKQIDSQSKTIGDQQKTIDDASSGWLSSLRLWLGIAAAGLIGLGVAGIVLGGEGLIVFGLPGARVLIVGWTLLAVGLGIILVVLLIPVLITAAWWTAIIAASLLAIWVAYELIVKKRRTVGQLLADAKADLIDVESVLPGMTVTTTTSATVTPAAPIATAVLTNPGTATPQKASGL